MKNLINSLFVLALFSVLFASCSKKSETASDTGWKYNDPQWGGFEKKDYEGQIDGPYLVLVEGGTFTQGRVSDEPVFDYNNVPRRVTVSSFYMDETEVWNDCGLATECFGRPDKWSWQQSGRLIPHGTKKKSIGKS